MATFSWDVKRFRVFLGMGGPPLEVVAYSSRRLVPFQLKQNSSPNQLRKPRSDDQRVLWHPRRPCRDTPVQVPPGELLPGDLPAYPLEDRFRNDPPRG